MRIRVLLTLPLLLVLSVLGPVAAAPAAPAEPAGLAVTGWAYGDASSGLIRRNAPGLSTLSIDGVTLTAAGTAVTRPGSSTRRVVRVAHRQGLTTELLVSNYSDRIDDFDPRVAHRLLAHPQRIRRVARQLAAYAVAGRFDGVNVDLERVPARDGAGLVAFVRALQRALPPARTVTVDVSAATSLAAYRRGGYRLAGLADAADVIKLMTYDQHGPQWSGPGPVGALPWQRAALRTLLKVVPRNQVDLGFGGYGYTWPPHGVGHVVTVARARRLVARDRVRPTWHARAGEWSARLDDGTRIWWSDRRSYRLRVELARSQRLHGVAVWRLGSADTLR